MTPFKCRTWTNFMNDFCVNAHNFTAPLYSYNSNFAGVHIATDDMC